MEETINFEEGQLCPVQIEGDGGGLSFSPKGDMLLIGRFPNPSKAQIEAWSGKWRAKLCTESEFPSIPIFAVGNEEWILETPCNPTQQEKETPGFCEALYRKEKYDMAAILVDSISNTIIKITTVPLEELFIERLVMSWNPFRGPADEYSKTFTNEQFSEQVSKIFKSRTQKDIWKTSW